MRIAADQRLILGPPGTGKTTRLLAIAEEELKRVDPNKIAYVSFTTQAVSEAVNRAKEKFNYTDADLPYFRTLHSLCFQLLNLKTKDIMQRPHYQQLGNELGYTFGKNDVSIEDGYPITANEGDRLLFVLGLLRNRRVTLEEQWHELNDPDLDLFELMRLRRGLADYKEQQGKIDFTDMLEELLLTKRHIKVDVVIIDEAQDLSSLQWEVCRALFPTAKRVYIAGDDDQALYRWAGADVETFLSLEGEKEILGKSYRLPAPIHRLASSVVERIGNRFQKKWEPREGAGTVQRLGHIDMIDLSAEGSWLLLARNGYMLTGLEEALRKTGKVYQKKGKSSVLHEDFLAIKYWEDLRKNIPLTGAQVKLVYAKLRGIKNKKAFHDDLFYPFEILQQHHGLTVQGIWHDALEGISLSTREYYISILRGGGKLSASPTIKLSTIHASKGGEADNVVLLTDMSYRTFQNYQRYPDDELRVFYVGMTRAKQNLTMIDASSLQGFAI